MKKAKGYNCVVYVGELSKLVKDRSKLSLINYWNWLDDVLHQIAIDCLGSGEPVLSALCVTSDGTVTQGHLKAVRNALGDSADVESHAALQRLNCYRHYMAEGLPTDGGSALSAAELKLPDPVPRSDRDESSTNRPAPEGTVGKFKTIWSRDQQPAQQSKGRGDCPECHLFHAGDCY